MLDSASTYFLCVDLRASGIAADDEAFAATAVERGRCCRRPAVGLRGAAIPSRHLVRLCFGKKDETIDAGVDAMAKAKELLA